MSRKKDPDQMTSKEIATAIMCDHLKLPKTQVAGWDVIEKIAEAIDEAEVRGERKANGNSILNLLMTSSNKKETKKEVKKEESAPVVTKEEKKEKKSSSTFGDDLIPAPSQDAVPGSL